MAATNSTGLARQVAEHGEEIIELKVIVRDLHENAKTDRVLLTNVSNAVIRLEARNAFMERLINWGIPLITGTIGVIAGHLWH